MLGVVVIKFTGKRHRYRHILGMYSYEAMVIFQTKPTGSCMCYVRVWWLVRYHR